MDTIVIGIDPGEVTGIARLKLQLDGHLLAVDYAQVTSGLLSSVLFGIGAENVHGARIIVATERFVVSQRAARSAKASAGTLARDLVVLVRGWASAFGYVVVERSAADVKPWATDERLDRAGLLAPAQKMRHAKDAGRHALYEACKSRGVADPMSRRGGAR